MSMDQSFFFWMIFFSAHEFHLTGFLIFFSAKRFFLFFKYFLPGNNCFFAAFQFLRSVFYCINNGFFFRRSNLCQNQKRSFLQFCLFLGAKFKRARAPSGGTPYFFEHLMKEGRVKRAGRKWAWQDGGTQKLIILQIVFSSSITGFSQLLYLVT